MGGAWSIGTDFKLKKKKENYEFRKRKKTHKKNKIKKTTSKQNETEEGSYIHNSK